MQTTSMTEVPVHDMLEAPSEHRFPTPLSGPAGQAFLIPTRNELGAWLSGDSDFWLTATGSWQQQQQQQQQ